MYRKRFKSCRITKSSQICEEQFINYQNGGSTLAGNFPLNGTLPTTVAANPSSLSSRLTAAASSGAQIGSSVTNANSASSTINSNSGSSLTTNAASSQTTTTGKIRNLKLIFK